MSLRQTNPFQKESGGPKGMQMALKAHVLPCFGQGAA